jgi:prepilin-type N-terminal cleavage/methylation domain-containing protein
LGEVLPTDRQGRLLPSSHWSQRRSYVAQAGFSLPELLVVMAILAIAMAAVMGTLSVALQTNRNNSALVEANNNVRAVINFIKNDLDNVGEPPLTTVLLSTSNVSVNPDLVARAVYVRGGFLEARGFPVGSGSQAPDRLSKVPPRLNAGTISTNCDILSPIQAWTTVSHGALSQGTFASPALVANQGYADTAGTPAATRYPDLRLYPGACDRTEFPTAYGNGSHQLITLQTNPVAVALNVNVPNPNNPNQTIERQQIFQVEATYEAIAQVSGGTLTLVPQTAPPSDDDFPEGTTFNLRPSRVAPNRVASNPFVNPDDRYLARRLRPFVDTLLLTFQFVPSSGIAPSSGNPTWLSFLGLVTAINDNDQSIVLGPDLAGINSQWSGLIQNGTHVTITRMRLSHYFVGWNGIQNGVASPPVLYYREGGLLSPLAFDIENLRLNFTLADEDLVLNNTPVQGILFNTSDIGGPINLPPGAPSGAVPMNAPRSPLTTKNQIRMVTVTVYGRSPERDRALIRADAAIPGLDDFNRGYFHVSARTTVGIRNLAPR